MTKVCESMTSAKYCSNIGTIAELTTPVFGTYATTPSGDKNIKPLSIMSSLRMMGISGVVVGGVGLG